MNLPPLPLVDGCLLIDNSFIEGFTSCPRMTEYQNLRKRASAFQRSALSFGTAVHEVLAYLSRTYNDHYKLGDPVVDKIITDYFEMNPMPEGEFRSEKLCRELVREYTSNYEIEPWSVVQSTKGPLVEMPFITKLYDSAVPSIPIYWTGKIDLVVDYKQRIWVVDRKTTSMLGSNFTYEQQMSAQHPGYCWSLWQTTGKIPAGFIVDALRVSEMSDKMRASTPAAQKKWWGEGFQRPEHYVTEGMRSRSH